MTRKDRFRRERSARKEISALTGFKCIVPGFLYVLPDRSLLVQNAERINQLLLEKMRAELDQVMISQAELRRVLDAPDGATAGIARIWCRKMLEASDRQAASLRQRIAAIESRGRDAGAT